jgi:hypothetical protein
MDAVECGKANYTSRREANIHIKELKRHSSRDKLPRRSYYCKECQCYHVTSLKKVFTDKREFLKYKQRIERKKLGIWKIEKLKKK